MARHCTTCASPCAVCAACCGRSAESPASRSWSMPPPRSGGSAGRSATWRCCCRRSPPKGCGCAGGAPAGAGVRLRGGSRQPAAAPPAALPGRLAGPVAYGPAACRAGWPARPGAQAPAPAMEDPARRAGGHHLRALAPATAADQARALRAGGLSARLQHSRLAAGAAQGGPVGAGRLARPRTVAVAMPARAGPGARARGLDGTLRTGPERAGRALSTLQQALAGH